MTKGNPSSHRPRLRRLSDDEIVLWLEVASSVSRREGASLPDRVAIPAAPAPDRAPQADLALKAPVKPAPSVQAPPLAPLERRLKQKLSRGRMTADAAIDLHGFRQNEAQAALRQFLQRSQSQGARVVLIVTGKGGRPGTALDSGGSETGVLRRAVPLWLTMPEFRPMVVGFEEAARQHGGSGALYVRLRRRERMLPDG